MTRAGAVVMLLGATVLVAYLFRHALFELVVAAGSTRLAWGFAKAQLASGRPERREP